MESDRHGRRRRPPAGEGVDQRLRPLRPQAAWFVTYLVVMALKWLIFTELWHRPLRDGVSAWDAQHYLAIAEHGYPEHLRQPYSILAFFPGTPLVVHALHLLTGSYVLAGFIESSVMGAVACCFAVALVARRYGQAAGARAAVVLAVAPGAFLLGMAYAEPLAIAMCLGALVFLERRRFVLAGGLGFVAGLSSPFAMPLVLAATYLAWSRREIGAALVACAAPLGFLAFQLYALVRTGRFPVWFAAERTFGQGFLLANTIDRFTRSSGVGIPATVALSLLLAAAAFAAMVKVRAPATWWLFAIAVVGVGLFSAGSWVNPRILLDAFPLELAVGVAVRGPAFRLLVVLSFVAMMAALGAYVVFWPNIVAQP